MQDGVDLVGRIRRCAPSSPSSSSNSTTASTTYTVLLERHPDVPLQVHADTRIEILAAFASGDRATVPPRRRAFSKPRAQMPQPSAFTLDKSSGAFSPPRAIATTRSVPTLIHRESQSTTRPTACTRSAVPTSRADGRSIMLFTRIGRADDRAFWFLGPATYATTSEAAMAITWELQMPSPGILYQSFAAAVA